MHSRQRFALTGASAGAASNCAGAFSEEAADVGLLSEEGLFGTGATPAESATCKWSKHVQSAVDGRVVA